MEVLQQQYSNMLAFLFSSFPISRFILFRERLEISTITDVQRLFSGYASLKRNNLIPPKRLNNYQYLHSTLETITKDQHYTAIRGPTNEIADSSWGVNLIKRVV